MEKQVYLVGRLRPHRELGKPPPRTSSPHLLTNAKLALAVSCSLLSVCVSLGYGRHNWDIPNENFDNVLLYSYAAGFTSILAAMWSKISFAITLLRITKGRPRALLWFIIASVTLVLSASATIHWIQCWPLDALWLSRNRSECLPRKVIVDYNVFVACRAPRDVPSWV